MTIKQKIVEWAAMRPGWQRFVLKCAARGPVLTNDDIAKLTHKLVECAGFDEATLALEDIPGASAEETPVELLRIGKPENINALVDSKGLSFEPEGLTVVYGDNGSGKSGYARLIKSIVRARHQEEVLTDVFSNTGQSPQRAEITVRVGGKSLDVDWPEDGCPELSQVGFYDGACGDAYITKESDVKYRPSSLFLLDELIRACDGVRAELDRKLEENEKGAKKLPELPEGTRVANFLYSLSGATTKEAVEHACKVGPDVDVEIERLSREEARLRATDPAKEKQRLRAHSKKLQRVAGQLAASEAALGEEAAEKLSKLHADLKAKRAAAEIASNKSFQEEPLSGVGSTTWKTLWEAARKFAEEEAYSGQSFPLTGTGSRCVLCQQELDKEAAARLRRFEEFVTAKTQRELDQAKTAWSKAVSALRNFELRPPDVESALEDLEEDRPEEVRAARSFFDGSQARADGLIQCCEREEWTSPSISLPSSPRNALEEFSRKLTEDADGMDDVSFEKEIEETKASRLELEARQSLAEHRDDILEEIERLSARAKLNAAKAETNTTGISRKSTDLAREHVTKLVRDKFTHESDRLLLERVTLDDLGSPKGKLHHKPAFVGAVQQVALPQVLSEGEQTALGLAGFFTEVFFDTSKSAVVVDDPVSSLDHVRRGHVAARLAEFATSRQVIVFTHDITFVNELRLAAEREDVSFTGRGIERRLSGEPGVCSDTHPWKAKDVKQRLQELEEEVARFKREKDSWDQQIYERETSDWAGKLSETWERMLSQEIVGQVVDRGTQEVRPKLFRLLAKITDDDDREFQASYACCSRWARRHDKSSEVNYVPPTVKEMEDELALVRAWFEQVRKYRN